MTNEDLKKMTVSERRAIAARPELPSELVVTLAGDADSDVRRAIAARPER